MTDGIYLLLGSNLGDRINNLQQAIKYIWSFSEIVKISSVYETAPWGVTDQPSFYNQVVEIKTATDPKSLLNEILKIEALIGRVRKEKWGARIIDIDILYYGDMKLHQEDLVIPHPGIAERKFTLAPLVEIAPDFLHPVSGKSNKEMLALVDDQLSVKKLDVQLK
ncbi:2-amino-4-hydroxy-6-hydroxymethyldihydropteridine diphosphokinase [Fulvivirga sp.]|uniref:2-amino-4-hydroxy-6- hydroxymethyldihydropteridine diphosphokinase n=1 Tax=Fulvivirga sp. TaxID=1931237 RepID=UPI0032EB5EB6